MALSVGPEAASKWRGGNNSGERETGSCALGVKQTLCSSCWVYPLLLLKVGSMEQQHWHDPGLGRAPDLLNQNLYFNQTPADLYAH